ncbi:MAG TPA: NAD(+)/NADH kinase [Streptosporangiaceae bacterium]|jgi:NAD+ kinase|nr:NAD(+)/NADH kinase [Streptosporangiaceae bacterium]
MVKTVGLVLHPGRNCDSAMLTILSWASGRGVTVLALDGEAERVPSQVDEVTADDLAQQSDLMVSLGGDGTMLRAMRLSAGPRPPVLGVNVGKLGFLAEIDPPEVGDALEAIDGNRFTVEPRSAVQADFLGGQHVAFNDVDLARIPGQGSSGVVELTVESHPFVRYAADAVIVATPTGSTAYNFSAGGPLVSPNAEGLLVTPAAPHSAFNRALFLSAAERLTLTVLPTSGELAVEADGIVVGHVNPGDTVQLRTLPAAAQVVRLGRTTFYQRAQRKLRLTGSAEAY